MEFNKIIGLISIILGLIFIIFPMFSSEMVSVIVGVSLLFFGITSIIMGLSLRKTMKNIGMISLIIGVIAIIFGLLFLFAINALSFLVGLQFYIVGFIMIMCGIIGLISREKISINSRI